LVCGKETAVALHCDGQIACGHEPTSGSRSGLCPASGTTNDANWPWPGGVADHLLLCRIGIGPRDDQGWRWTALSRAPL